MPHGWYPHPCTRTSETWPAPQGNAPAPQGSRCHTQWEVWILLNIHQVPGTHHRCQGHPRWSRQGEGYQEISSTHQHHWTPEVHVHDEPAGKIHPQSSRQQCSTASSTAQEQIKQLLTSPPVLVHYDPKCPTVIAADASNTGIRAVLQQTQGDGSRQPFCFIFPSLSDTQKKNYAVIVKEALAATWACERFSDYMLGLNFAVETDHKPLVPLLSTAELHKMPPRIQPFRLHFMKI